MRKQIIKFLGGYTEKEYQHLEKKYDNLLLKDIDFKTVQICNESIFNTLKDIEEYAQKLYGSNDWAKKMYNVIHNNKVRLFIFLNSAAGVIYKFNSKLDKDESYVWQQ